MSRAELETFRRMRLHSLSEQSSRHLEECVCTWRGAGMIYVFALTIGYTFIKRKEQLLSSKRNLVLFLFLSIIGLVLGIIYIINPYLPSLTLYLEKYMK